MNKLEYDGEALKEIIEGLDHISDDDIARSHRVLDPRGEHETVIGVVTSQHQINIWALGFVYAGQAEQYGNMSIYEARTAEEAKHFLAEASRYKRMSGFCRQLFWVEACHTIGTEAYLSETLGIREGMEIVAAKKQDRNLIQIPFPFPLPGSEGE